MALPLILGKEKESEAQYLNVSRSKRNIVEYDYVGGVSKDEAEELISFVTAFRKEIVQWLKENHSEFL